MVPINTFVHILASVKTTYVWVMLAHLLLSYPINHEILYILTITGVCSSKLPFLIYSATVVLSVNLMTECEDAGVFIFFALGTPRAFS